MYQYFASNIGGDVIDIYNQKESILNSGYLLFEET